MDTKQLVTDNLVFLKGYLPKLSEAIEKIVEYLTKYEESNAFELLPHIIEGLEWSITSLSGLEKLGYISDLKNEELNKSLEEIEEAMKKKDYVSMNDIFQYEIIEIVDDWLVKVNSINLDGDSH